MLGAIAGDMIGSPYEHAPIKHSNFQIRVAWFTDDTLLSIAVADAILNQAEFGESLLQFARRYPHLGYGGSFIRWFNSPEPEPYNSFGNGSAMRVSPVGFAYESIDEVLLVAKKTAEVTHNHPQGIKGAQATALAIFLARQGQDKATIRSKIAERFDYNLNQTIAEIRPDYAFDVTCQGSVPESIIAFLDSDSYEEAVKLAISLGGDADTMACIAGGLAQAYYKAIPASIVKKVRETLPQELLDVVDKFNDKYQCVF